MVEKVFTSFMTALCQVQIICCGLIVIGRWVCLLERRVSNLEKVGVPTGKINERKCKRYVSDTTLKSDIVRRKPT